MRASDVAAHDQESEIFVAALLDRARERDATPSPTDCRSALERLRVALAGATGLRVETGWTLVATIAGDPRLRRAVGAALERGARERERYDFFSTVGHELRTPLTAIRGYLETLLDRELAPGDARRFVEVAHAESLRLARLLDGMFEISLFDMRAVRTPDQGSDVASAIARALDVLRPYALRRNVTLATAPCSLAALVAPDHLTQMLVNLLENAIKHGRAGGTVIVTAEKEGRFVRIAVDDDGPGIPEAERERIFALSYRGVTGADGSGIGLAFVRLMAERIGGDVVASASELGGARFTLRLPLQLGGGAS